MVPRGALAASRACRIVRPSRRAQGREQLVLRPVEKLFLLVGADLDGRDLVEAGVEERLYLLYVLFHVGPIGKLCPLTCSVIIV